MLLSMNCAACGCQQVSRRGAASGSASPVNITELDLVESGMQVANKPSIPDKCGPTWVASSELFKVLRCSSICFGLRAHPEVLYLPLRYVRSPSELRRNVPEYRPSFLT